MDILTKKNPNDLDRRVLRRFSNSKCFLEEFLEGALWAPGSGESKKRPESVAWSVLDTCSTLQGHLRTLLDTLELGASRVTRGTHCLGQPIGDL